MDESVSSALPSEILRSAWFLVGPTASGKTAAGIELALRLGAEIISLDSMAVYRGLDLGTAKPSADERSRVRHHLVDVIEPSEDYSVAAYLEAAGKACGEIVARGKVVLFVGGTGLYLRSVLRGLSRAPQANLSLRQSLEAEAIRDGNALLHQRLKLVDPAASRRIHPSDRRRIIRALEVHEQTGRPLSEWNRQPALPPGERPANVFWLSPPRDWLYRRIDQRVDQMMARGLLAEVRVLLTKSPPLSRSARQSLGYKELIDHLESGHSLESAVETIKTRTRQFAKRQHTWFRNLEECRPIPMTGEESSPEIAERIFAAATEKS